jgi:hypothetical protein
MTLYSHRYDKVRGIASRGDFRSRKCTNRGILMTLADAVILNHGGYDFAAIPPILLKVTIKV